MQAESILIIRLSAIGDVVMASGVIPALRHTFPRARIDWLVQSECKELLQGTQGLDHLLVWPRKEWRQLWRQGKIFELLSQAQALVQKLRDTKYDLVLDLQGLWKSGIWGLVSGARHRVGLRSREGGWLTMSEVVAVDDDTRISSEYRTLLDHLGIEHPDYRLGLQYFPEDLSGAQALLREKGLDGPLALLCPFTTRPQKHWSESRWARLADRLEQDLGLRAVLLGAKPDLAAAERIQDRARQQLTSLVGRTSLRQSLALVEQADLVIGVDTGLTHMAVLSDVPTIALFGPTRPYLQSQNKRAVILYHPFSCSPCKRSPVCQGRYPCMAKHEVDTIFERAKQILRS